MSEPVNVTELHLEIRLDAPRERTWRALTDDIGTWWPSGFCVGGDGTRFRLDARPGGLMLEDWGGGEGLVWMTVVGVKKEELLHLKGDLFPQYGGPSRFQTSWRLEDAGDATLVRFDAVYFGRLSEKTVKSLDAGWRYLIEGCLAAHLAGREAPPMPGG